MIIQVRKASKLSLSITNSRIETLFLRVKPINQLKITLKMTLIQISIKEVITKLMQIILIHNKMHYIKLMIL